MNNISLLKNIFRALSSNALGVFASAFIILILPKFVGLEEYSYWQLYVFYASYVGLLHFGWSDGFYLCHGGKDYSNLDKGSTSSNYYSFVLFQLFIALIVFFFSLLIEGDYAIVISYVALCLLITNVRSYSQFILQATYRIKEYSSIIIMEKILLVTGVSIVLLFFEVTYQTIIVVDLSSRLFALLVSSYRCKDVLYSRIICLKTIQEGFKDARIYVSSGFKVMFSFVCGLLIFGVIRYTIEIKWGILAFGEVSLALSVATLFVVFVNTVSIVLFPVLRNVTHSKRKIVYERIRISIFLFLIILCNAYYPIEFFIYVWLPDYKSTLEYLPLIFPILLFETKVSILTNTFMKVLRRESTLLNVNLFLFLLSLFFSSVVYLYGNNIETSLIVLVILSALRYVLSDYLLSRYIGVVNYKLWFFDVLFVIIFIGVINNDLGYLYTVITLPLIPLLIYKINKYKK